MLGKYRIIEEIGHGGMGTVYKGVDSVLERIVAVKVLAAHLTSHPQFVRRFRREAESAAKLNHPNIVHIYDIGVEEKVGSTDNEIHYLVMEYVEGQTLKQLMSKKEFQLKEVAEVISQIASALDYAHAFGIIHRDVKPGNILVAHEGLKLKMTDFGLALVLEEIRLTARGQILGTPEYISPEQALGKRVDFTADIYSLGVITYRMLTGKHPFSAETPIGIIYKQAYEKPLPMEGFSGALPAVVLKAMAKEPALRYSSAQAFVEALCEAGNKQRGMFLKREKVLIAMVMAILGGLFISTRSVQLLSAVRRNPAVSYGNPAAGQMSPIAESLRGAIATKQSENPRLLRDFIPRNDTGSTTIESSYSSGSGEVIEPAELRFREGEMFIKDGKYDNARNRFEFVLREYSDSVWAGYAKAGLTGLHSKIEEKLTSKRARELNLTLQEADDLFECGRYREAGQKYRELVKESPDSEFEELIVGKLKKIRQEEDMHYRKALSYAEHGRIGYALKHFYYLLDEKPDVRDRISGLGVVFIPAGEFMRRDKSGRYSKVYLNAFYIQRHEVTNTSYRKFLPSHNFTRGNENYPVEEVSWVDASRYAEWAGMGLPTDEEWEKAAFGVDGKKYPWGNRFSNRRCNVGLNLGSLPVGSYPSGISPYGLYDMIGNVWEWISNPSDAASSWRIIRGASWNEIPVKGHILLRASLDTDEKRRNVGFRCCWRIEE